jgi:16S rRNA (uracil1498-N3)-methyltransferase
MMELEIVESLREFKRLYPDSYLLNFSKKSLQKSANIKRVIVGCEGGFDKEEIELFKNRVVGFDSSLILQSHTAAISLASIMLL